MAVDTILNTATALQTTTQSTIKQADKNQNNVKNNRLSNMIRSIETTGRADSIDVVDSKITGSVPSESLSLKNDQKRNDVRDVNKVENSTKSDKIKETTIKNNTIRNNKIQSRFGMVSKLKENTKSVKVTKDNETDKTKENGPVVKSSKRPSGKRNTQEDDGSSDESSTEYVTFDAYLDKISNGTSLERKDCFNRLDNNSSPVPCKPSSSSSSISSISTININDDTSTSFLHQNSTFDAKSFRTSLLEASELPRHDILSQTLSKEKELEHGHICAWTPTISSSSPVDLKTNASRLTSKRLQFQNQQQQNVSMNPFRIQRSLTMTQSSSQKDDNVNNSLGVPSVYDRLASLGRFREFCFQHKPDDLGWYIKEYNATQTVGRVGIKKKKKQLRFGVDVPDPYATMGKRVVNGSYVDSRQNTFYQGDSVTSSVKSKERQPKKYKNVADDTATDASKDEGSSSKNDRNYPVLAQTRDANPANTNAGKGSKSDKTTTKSTVCDVKDKRQQASKNKNSSNSSIIHNNNNNTLSNGNQSQPGTQHPVRKSHLHHPGLTQLSGDDVKLDLVSSKILHRKDPVDTDENEDIDETEKEEGEKLWQNPFPSPKRFADEMRIEKTAGFSVDKHQTGNPITENEKIVDRNSKESFSKNSSQPSGSDGKRNKHKSKTKGKDENAQSQHLKAELERENDGSLIVKIQVFSTDKTKKEKDSNDKKEEKKKTAVKICREESKLLGKELHEKLKLLNNTELSKNGINISCDQKDEPNGKDSKNMINKVTEVNKMKNNVKISSKKKANSSSNKEKSPDLQGTERKRTPSKSKSVLKEKNGVDFLFTLDNVDLYPRQRTPYQEIEYISNHKMMKSKPTIKYTKSKSDEKEADQDSTPTKDSPGRQGGRHGKGQIHHQTMLIRSSTVHLAKEIDLENSEETDIVPDRVVHQVYPLNDWKRSVDEGKCGFIVKSFPIENNGLTNRNRIINPDSEITGVGKSKKNASCKENNNISLSKSMDSSTLYGERNNLLYDVIESDRHPNNHRSMSLYSVDNSSLPIENDRRTTSKPQPTSIHKSRPLYRSKPELPLIKVSTNNPETDRNNDVSTTSIKTCHFPPINPSENFPDKQKALDDLFISGVNQDRSRPRDNSFISKKRPVSLDRGLIDDLVRYHTETTNIGTKSQQNQVQMQLQNSNPHLPNSHHHHSFSTTNQFQQPLKTQPEEAPSLTPSVQRLSKVQANPRPCPKSPKTRTEMTSSFNESREIDHKLQMQIYAHVRKNASNSNSNDNASVDKSSKASDQRHQLPDLQHLLGLNKLI